MSFADAVSAPAVNDFTLLEGLYELTVSGHTDDWEFERLNNAVYERLLSAYEVPVEAAANNAMANVY